MALQDKYIGNISKEIKLINNDIYTSSVEVNKLKRQLDTLRDQYARSVVYAYKNRSTYDYLNFIFSANSFNDALKRIAYLKSYRSYREQQVANIQETQELIEDQRQQLLGKQTEKKSALQNQTKQLDVLEDQKKEKMRCCQTEVKRKRTGQPDCRQEET
jgi:peptidoglycan hydrolase CwlO-like protein